MKGLLMLAICFSGAHLFGQSFPKDWEGKWEGVVEWYKGASQTPEKVPMSLAVFPDTVGWSWKITYGQKTDDVRPYILLPKDTAKGHWVIDEKNGIVIDQFFVGGRLTGVFTVQQSTLLSTSWRNGETLIMEFYFNGKDPIEKTGNNILVYKVGSYQRAVLKKASQ